MTVLAIVGPTASGKSDLALALAPRLGGEIVSVDSMQVYVGMDAGTAKPTPSEQSAVTHHLIDILDPTDTFDASSYRELALRAIDEIASRGRVPILVGGTGLYFSVLTGGLSLAPTDPAVRGAIEAEVASGGIAPLVDELLEARPDARDVIDIKNPRRVVRAVEIERIRVRSNSQQSAMRRESPYGRGPVGMRRDGARDFELFGAAISLPKEVLRRRISLRTSEMFARGLVDETIKIFAPDLRHASLVTRTAGSATAAQALGYKEVAEAIAAGNPPESAVAAIEARTNQLARRQRAWFRRDERLAWFSASEPELLTPALGSFFESRLARSDRELAELEEAR